MLFFSEDVLLHVTSYLDRRTLTSFLCSCRMANTDEIAIDKNTGKVIVRVNPDFYRPAEVDLLVGNATKAKRELNWQAETKIDALAAEMVDSDLQLLRN